MWFNFPRRHFYMHSLVGRHTDQWQYHVTSFPRIDFSGLLRINHFLLLKKEFNSTWRNRFAGQRHHKTRPVAAQDTANGIDRNYQSLHRPPAVKNTPGSQVAGNAGGPCAISLKATNQAKCSVYDPFCCTSYSNTPHQQILRPLHYFFQLIFLNMQASFSVK